MANTKINLTDTQKDVLMIFSCVPFLSDAHLIPGIGTFGHIKYATIESLEKKKLIERIGGGFKITALGSRIHRCS